MQKYTRHSPSPRPRVGWGNTEELTNASVKFSTTGTKKLGKTSSQVGFSINYLIYLRHDKMLPHELGR